VNRRGPTALLLALFLVTGYASWDNVLSDNADVRAAAEAKACSQKKCADKHGLTKTDRTPFGQTFEYTWRDGVVRVSCTRSAWVVGPRTCVIE
jgi:hypothetical protein